MPDMSSVLNNVHFSLFKGEPGTRKSTAALTYPLPQYWLCFDQKMNALSIPMRRWNIDPKQISYDDYNDWTEARKKLELFIYSQSLDASAPPCPYKTIVLDSVTSCADYMLRQVRKNKSGTKTKSGQSAVRQIGGIDVSDIEDFNAESSGLTEMIALTKQIHKLHKIDVILIAHVIRTESRSLDGMTNITRTIVTAGKKPAAKIPAYCDEIYHFGVETAVDVNQMGNFIVQTANAGDDYARTTLELPTKIEMGGDNLYEKWIKPAITQQQTK